jgi:hypothetical protein
VEMPNWCSNTVTFKHDDPEKIKVIAHAWNSGEFMSSFFPCPKDLEETTSGWILRDLGVGPEQQELVVKELLNTQQYGYKNWYDWRVAEWGTKWDVGRKKGNRSLSVKSGAKKVKISFSSAWSPPIGFYEKIHDQLGYEVEAYFCEPGVGFCGSWRNGVIADFSLENIKTVDDLRATIPVKIISEFDIAEMVAEK